jgi:transcriptional regulator with XRE-family HTH domain
MPAGKQDAAGPLARAVSAEIRAMMGRQNLTQRDLAAKTSLSQNYLSKRLRDLVSFTLNDLETIAPILGVTDLRILQNAARSVDEGLNNWEENGHGDDA